ncbi:MAG: C4-type zinc ribbon domain-containing protein [Thermaerobacterales bacterium]
MPITPEQLKKLLNLQERDTALQKAQARVIELQEGAEVKRIQSEVDRLEGRLVERREQLAALERAVGRLELEVETLRDERKKLETRLYGGEVSSVKEMQKIEDRMGLVAQEISKIEQQALDGMEKGEVLKTRIEKMVGEVAKGRSILQRREQQRQEDLQTARIEADQAVEKRDAAAVGIDEDLLTRYRKLLERVGGLAVVPVRQDACGGCDVELSVVLANQVKKRDNLYTCEHCGRGLVWTGS